MYYKLSENTSIQYEIKKSKFLGFSYFVNNEEDIKNILEELKEKYHDATHICYAYVCNGLEKYQDDGEPSGTAGKPILDMIKQKKLNYTLIIIVRYFGGIKLGSGGLVRAYRTSANMVIDNSNIVEVQKVFIFEFEVTFENYKGLVSLLNQTNSVILDTTYQETIKIMVAIKKNETNEFNYLLINSKFIKVEYR